MKNLHVLTTLCWISLIACKGQTTEIHATVPLASPTPSTRSDCRDGNPNLPMPSRGYPTFNQDIFPLLESVADGKVYKCITCHDQYRKVESVRSDLERILDSVESRRMPIGGNPMTTEDVQMLRDWRDRSDFAVGGAQDSEASSSMSGPGSGETATDGGAPCR